MPNSALSDDAFAPVFVVGCPRSGTTLVQRLLGAHPMVAAAPETFFVRHHWMRRAAYGPLTGNCAFRRAVDDLVRAPAFGEMGLEAGAFRRAAAEGERTWPALFRLLLSRFAAREGARVVAEKTPNHALYLDVLARFFPAMRVVHVLRDPRAVAWSWRRVPWSTGLVAADAGVWVRYVEAARRALARRPRAMHTVRYERLVRAPEAEARRLCRFLALPFEAAMLRFHQTDAAPLDLAREPWKARAAEPIDARAATRWQREAPTRFVADVEAVAVRAMRRWGYAPETTAAHRAVAWCRTRPGLARRKLRLIAHALGAPVRAT
jgi:hypothetical protein